MAKKGSLIVISGFSGVGKGTVVKKMVAEYGYSLSVSATTRAPREGEVDGREYYFKSVDEFRNLIDYNGFIEWAQYVENYYGTPRKFVEDEMAKGHDVILEIEVQGAMNVREQYPDAILIFITAPSAKELRSVWQDVAPRARKSSTNACNVQWRSPRICSNTTISLSTTI